MFAQENSDWITTYLVPAVTFGLGLGVKYFFDWLGKSSEKRHARREQQTKQKRDAYQPFLKHLETILVAEDTPPADVVKAAREQLVQIEIDGSDQIITVSKILLFHLENQARGVKTSHDHLIPTYRKLLLELVRSELHGRKPTLAEINAELLQDPLLAMLAGIPSEPMSPGTVEILYDYDARGVAKKSEKEVETKKN